MKNLLKWSTYLLVATLIFNVSCGDDDPEPTPVDELVGKWALSSAIFIETSKEPTDVLTIEQFPTEGGLITLQVPSGNSILDIVVGSMADGVCMDPANYGTFYLELNEAGELLLNCPAESESEVSGSWSRTEDAQGETVIVLTVITDAGSLNIAFSDYNMLTDGSKFTGTTTGYPMVEVFGEDLAPGTNLQLLTVDMEFTSIP